MTIQEVPRWLKITAAAIIGLVVIALIAPLFIDVDRYRPQIASAIEAQTGRTVSLGKIHARFLPRAEFVVDDFHLGNPPGFPAGDLVSAQEIRGNLALLPLFHGDVHLTSLDLVSAKIELIAGEQGRNNYTFSPSLPRKASLGGPLEVADAFAQNSGSPSATASSSENSPVSLDRIDHIELTNTEVITAAVVQNGAVPSADIRSINMTIRDFVVNPMNVENWQADSSLSGVNVIFGGWSAPVVFHSGQLTLAAGKLDAQFVADLAKAAEVRGTLSIPDVRHPQVNFEMSAAQLDLDALIAAVSAAGSAPDPPGADPPAPQSGEDQLVASGHANIEKITTRPYQVGPANAEIRMYADRMELWPITVAMYGGALQVSARVDRTATPSRFSANVQVRGVDVAKVLEVSPSARGKMSGRGDLDLQLIGSLTDAWKKSLSGSGKFSVRNGKLPGVNLAGAAQSLAKFAGLGSDTPFSSLAGDIDIADQRVSSKQIQLYAASGTVDLHGDVTFDGALNYQAQVALSPSGAIGSSPLGGILGSLFGGKSGKIIVPFALRGTIQHPQVAPTSGSPGS